MRSQLTLPAVNPTKQPLNNPSIQLHEAHARSLHRHVDSIRLCWPVEKLQKIQTGSLSFRPCGASNIKIEGVMIDALKWYFILLSSPFFITPHCLQSKFLFTHPSIHHICIHSTHTHGQDEAHWALRGFVYVHSSLMKLHISFVRRA